MNQKKFIYLGKDAYPQKQVYLGTVITDLTLEQARWAWQPEFEKLLHPHIHCFSPLRGYDHGEVYEGVITTKCYNDNPLTSDMGIVRQDFCDVMSSDALVMNYLGARNRSIGMSGEVAWAWAAHKAVISIMEKTGNPNDHAFIRAQSSYIVQSKEEAAYILNRLLTPGL